MALILRSGKGSSLTNDELDGNFVFLNTQDGLMSNQISGIINTTLPDLRTEVLELMSGKQPLADRLTSISNIPTTENGLIVNRGNLVIPRVLESSNVNLIITYGDGADGNPTFDLGDDVLLADSSHVVSNKTISGITNTLTDVPLGSAVSGVLPIERGGTGGSSLSEARTSLVVARAPEGFGVVVQTAADTTRTTSILSSGVGISVTNAQGLEGNITINSNATFQNSANTIVSRDASGNFSAGVITATLNGHASTASSVPNGVVTTTNYSNPSWISSLAGSKVYSIPNSSLQNSTVTINGQVVALGSGIDLASPGASTNTANQLVKRDSHGNFSAGTITANLNGNATSASTVTNGVVTIGNYNNPAWITSLDGSKVYSIPNSSLQNNTVTINGYTIALGGSATIPDLDGTSDNIINRIVKRDASGNFSAGTITATLNGNANTATSASQAAQAVKLATARTINGVAFDGTANITIADNTKLPLTGGSLSGQLEVKQVEYTFTAGNTGSSFTPNWVNGTIQTVIATAPFTLQLPVNMPVGASLTIIVSQDSAGNRAMTTASGFKFAGGFKTLSILGNAVDMINIFRVGATYFATLTTGYV